MQMHSWDVTVKEATQIQKKLQERVSLTPLKGPIRTIAGADISFNRFSDNFLACVVVFSYPDLVEIERAFVRKIVKFPYVPGYLSFREVPAIAQAFASLAQKPDVLIMDGHGIAHPRRLGVATHLGLVLDTPTIGCAKSLLYGEHSALQEKKGSRTPLIDPKTGHALGELLRTKDGVKPVIVSPGHSVSLEQAVDIVESCVRRHRIPEPTRLAHELVNAFRRGELRK